MLRCGLYLLARVVTASVADGAVGSHTLNTQSVTASHSFGLFVYLLVLANYFFKQDLGCFFKLLYFTCLFSIRL